jgi:hypothetical protein
MGQRDLSYTSVTAARRNFGITPAVAYRLALLGKVRTKIEPGETVLYCEQDLKAAQASRKAARKAKRS